MEKWPYGQPSSFVYVFATYFCGGRELNAGGCESFIHERTITYNHVMVLFVAKQPFPSTTQKSIARMLNSATGIYCTTTHYTTLVTTCFLLSMRHDVITKLHDHHITHNQLTGNNMNAPPGPYYGGFNSTQRSCYKTIKASMAIVVNNRHQGRKSGWTTWDEWYFSSDLFLEQKHLHLQ